MSLTKRQYRDYQPTFTNDEIIVDGHIIMEKREKGFIEESIRQLYQRYQPRTVLELGYGYGYSAKEHRRLGAIVTVVEANAEIAQRARDDGFLVIEGFAQDLRWSTSLFDLVYDDRYDLFDTSHLDSRIPCRFYAPWCSFPEHRDDWRDKTGRVGFDFSYGGQTYYQPVIIK